MKSITRLGHDISAFLPRAWRRRMSEVLAEVIPDVLDKPERAGRKASQLIWNDESGAAVYTDDPAR